MATETTPLHQLKFFLNQLFQFESQDLDFGVYKILHYKRKEIRQFIDDLLENKVKEQLQTLADAQTKEVLEQLQELEKDDSIQVGKIYATRMDEHISSRQRLSSFPHPQITCQCSQ